MAQVPHVIPYQGSKRKLAARILAAFPRPIDRLIEPFAGSAAVTLRAAAEGRARRYEIGEALEPLAALWRLVVDAPKALADEYEALWRRQAGKESEAFLEVREAFNRTQDPAKFLYLMARCVKGAVRFNSSGQFNQSADNRRKGMQPALMRANIFSASGLLAGKTSVYCGDYEALTEHATSKDLIYMDPPWVGTSTNRDRRYARVLELDRLLASIDSLNRRGVPFLLSLDGRCGDKEYGQPLPDELCLTRLDLHAGRSTQATLIGRNFETVESLYVSPAISRRTSLAALKSAVSSRSPQIGLDFD